MSKIKKHICIFISLSMILLTVHAAIVIYFDPFFHYHKPLEDYYYTRDETIERYCNDGVLRHFDYDALVTGISVSNGFSTSEFDELFGTNSEKVIYLGGTFKETGEGIERALKTHPDTKIVFCSLFLTKLLQDKDHRRSDILVHPTYMSNDNPFDDVQYLFNKEVSLTWIEKMIQGKKEGKAGGVESLDSKSYLHVPENEIVYHDPSGFTEDEVEVVGNVPQVSISDAESDMVIGNVTQNILEAAEKYPDTRFIYFVPPVSILFYRDLYNDGELKKTLDAERIAMELMVQQSNIEIYSFNDHPEIIEDLRNYQDTVHYGGWINTFILKNVAEGKGRITSANLEWYLEYERQYFESKWN